MNGLPALHVLSLPLSRMVAPYASGLGRWPGSQDTETFIPDTNLLERLFLEERHRLKIIPNACGEKAVLKLMFDAFIRAAERWRNIWVTEFERRQMHAIRRELDEAYEAETGLNTKPSNDAPQAEISSSSRT